MIRLRLIHRIPAVLAAAVVCLCVSSVRAQVPKGSAEAREAEGAVIPIGNQSVAGGRKLEIRQVDGGTSARGTKKAALDQLPLGHLTPEARRTAEQVLDNLSLYRRLPTVQLEADRRIYEFFTWNPEVAVSLWRAMDISEVNMLRKSPREFVLDSGDGTRGFITVLHQGPGSHLIHCQGEFVSPAIKKPLQAQALMHLQPKFSMNAVGQQEVTHTLDLFVSFPSQALETVAKVVSPVSNHIADRNFEEVSLFVELMDMAMSHQPGWVEQLSTELDSVAPESPDQLLRVTAAVYVDSQKRLYRDVQLPVDLEPMSPLRKLLTRP